jgi:hypothetical protein
MKLRRRQSAPSARRLIVGLSADDENLKLPAPER